MGKKKRKNLNNDINNTSNNEDILNKKDEISFEEIHDQLDQHTFDDVKKEEIVEEEINELDENHQEAIEEEDEYPTLNNQYDEINAEINKENQSRDITDEKSLDTNAEISDSSNKEENKKSKKKKKEKKSKRPKAHLITTILAVLVVLIILLGIAGVGAGIYFASKLLEDKPELNVSDLRAPNSSIILDAEGNVIYEVGTYLRENIDYDQMPNVLIDAFLAIEDSRFFEHPGFDIPRFSKAILVNLQSRSFEQGGSTLTMQLVKNTYYSVDDGENSTIADREGMSGIKRKVQEIVLALELDYGKLASKQDIIAMYINKVNYGNNLRGVQKAANYYFGKDASELNLSESAFLAGLINSPNSYNPYNDLTKYTDIYLNEDSEYLVNATNRRDEVLDLMVYHGYISQAECDLAKSVRIEDMLYGITDNFFEVNDKYQSYIDRVIDEVYEITGESPYEVGMEIHTNMNPYMQEYIYDIQNEDERTGITFPDDLMQNAIVLLNNQTGAIEALGGGRGETESARSFNRATSAYLNPGSSFKPIVDYALAFEYLGWATSHTITDMPYYLYNGSILISNYDHEYHGDMLLTEALGRSQNTPAVQTLEAVVNKIGEEAVIDYLNSIGFVFDYDDFDLQFAIGGNRCTVTPLQLAAAHGMFINGGRYIKPHTIDYIVYSDGRDNYVADTEGVQRLSSAAAYMTAYLEYYNMYGNYSSLMWYCKKDYPLYGKTGTTDWANSGREYGIPNGATKDSWLVMQTNKYTISCWTGFDQLEKGAYFTNAQYQENTKSKIVSKILDELIDHHLGEYDPYPFIEMPDTVTEVTHVKGAYPYAYPTAGYASVTGYIAKKSLEENPLCSVSVALENLYTKEVRSGIAGLAGSYDGNTLSVSFTPVSGGENGPVSGENADLSTTNYYGDTTYASGTIFFPHYVIKYTGQAVAPYFYNIYSGYNLITSGSTNTNFFNVQIPGYTSIKACVLTSDGKENCITVKAP